jgi:hypothetical protein
VSPLTAVVEGVPADVIGRLKAAGDDHPLGPEGQRRQQPPLNLRGEAEGPATPQPSEDIAVGAVDHDQLGDQRDQRPEVFFEFGVRLGGQHQLHHPEALHAIEQWQPQPMRAARGRAGDHLDSAKRPPGHGGLDRQLLTVGHSGAGQRHQGRLLVVGQIDHGLPGAQQPGMGRVTGLSEQPQVGVGVVDAGGERIEVEARAEGEPGGEVGGVGVAGRGRPLGEQESAHQVVEGAEPLRLDRHPLGQRERVRCGGGHKVGHGPGR